MIVQLDDDRKLNHNRELPVNLNINHLEIRKNHGVCRDLVFKWGGGNQSPYVCSDSRQSVRHNLEECQSDRLPDLELKV